MNKTLIPLNVINRNGQMYTADMFENFKNEYFIYEHNAVAGPMMDISAIRGTVRNLQIDGDKVIGDIQLLDLNANKDVLLSLIADDVITIRPFGTVYIRGKSVEDYQLLGFTMVHAIEDSFNLTSDI